MIEHRNDCRSLVLPLPCDCGAQRPAPRHTCDNKRPHNPHRADEAPPSADAMATAVARAIVAAAVFIEHDSDAVSAMTWAAMAKLAAACEAVAPGEIERMRKVVSG